MSTAWAGGGAAVYPGHAHDWLLSFIGHDAAYVVTFVILMGLCAAIATVGWRRK